MDVSKSSFSSFLKDLGLVKYRIQFSRLSDKPFVYVATLGLNKVGLLDVFTISKSPCLDASELLLRTLVKGMLETNQSPGIRRDLIKHPHTNLQLRYFLKVSDDKKYIVATPPDENNKLPGEKGYINFL